MTIRMTTSTPYSALAAAVLLTLLVSTPATSQNARPASMRALRALGLDSIPGPVTVCFRPADSSRAKQLQALAEEGVVFFVEKIGIRGALRLGVLTEEDWKKVTDLPFGFPNNSGPIGNLIVAPITYPPERRLDPAGRLNDLGLLFHEGGHLLTWQLVDPASLRDSTTQARLAAIPPWYWEFAANYFLIAFLEATRPAEGAAAHKYFDTLVAVPQPKFSHLDQMMGLMQERTSEGQPYILSDDGSRNFGWYQGVVGLLAEHVYRSQDIRLFAHVRDLMQRHRPPTTRDIIRELEDRAPGLMAKLEALQVTWR